jgi:hypothetical protein
MAFYDLPGKTILMHNRCGIRIELNFDREGLLELWTSPRAGRSLSYRDRNFSNRDDHTRLFDRISLPGLTSQNFVACTYDPFYSVIRFKRQTLHVMTLFEDPVVAIWCENEQHVDMKSDKQDRATRRTSRAFEVAHVDRGVSLRFAAVIGLGKGRFVHQRVLDRGRSTYCRAMLAAGQMLVIGGGATAEGTFATCIRAAGQDFGRLRAKNEFAIGSALQVGAITLRGRPALQKLVDVSRRALMAMQDTSGAVRAALNRIYYLIWVRDGAIIECFNGYTGSATALRNWADFLLANPTVIKNDAPAGRMYGQLVNPITKWQEDGPFYAVWTAFCAWTQGPELKPPSAVRLRTLNDAVDWLERYCFDRRRGLFGRFYACETPLPGSHDDGADGAVGKATTPTRMRLGGKTVRRSYDVYVNLYMYAAYEMLACMTSGARSRVLRSKAQRLAGRITVLFHGRLPAYGDVLTDGGVRRSGPYGLDRTDFIWGLTIPPFTPQPWRMPAIRLALLQDALMGRKSPYFLAGYFSICAGVDPLHCGEQTVVRAVEKVARQSYAPGVHLPMPYAMKEMESIPDGHPWHDVRPQAFSIGPFLATLCGLGLRRLPFGLAVRPSSVLAGVTGYQYRGHTLAVRFQGKGRRCFLAVDGRRTAATLQIPESLLNAVHVRVDVRATSRAAVGPLLVASTVRLQRAEMSEGGVAYVCTAYGRNVLEFQGVSATGLSVSRNGRVVSAARRTVGGITYVEFEGRGEHVVLAQCD